MENSATFPRPYANSFVKTNATSFGICRFVQARAVVLLGPSFSFESFTPALLHRDRIATIDSGQ